MAPGFGAGGAVNSGAAGAAGPGLGACRSGVFGAGGPGRGPGVGGWGVLLGPGVAGRGPGVGAALPLAAGLAGPGVGGVGLPGAALRGAAGLAAGRPEPLPCWKASVSLRTTGASMVEDAERTNSPSSWSLAMTTLLSTPSSLASSYTRTFATSLLLVRIPPDRRYFMGVLIAYSSSAHRNLDLLPTREVPDRTDFPCRSLTVAPVRAVQPARRLRPARRCGAVPWCPALPSPGRPGGTPDGGSPDRDRPVRGAHTLPDRAAYREDRGRTRPRPAPYAADHPGPHAHGTPHRFAEGMHEHASGQTQFSLPPRTPCPLRGKGPPGSTYSAFSPARRVGDRHIRSPADSVSVSGRMSIRQPVSRAASRAFCPSLPIARESW